MSTTPRNARKRQSAVAAAEQIKKLVAVLQRQFTLTRTTTTTAVRPDDAAARNMGYQLGQALVTFLAVCLDETVLKTVRDEIVLEGLWCRPTNSSGHLHRSVGAALFGHLVEAYQNDAEDLLDYHFLATWLIRLHEEASTTVADSASEHVRQTLYQALHCYQATVLRQQQVTSLQLLQLYQRLPQLHRPLIQSALTVGTSSTVQPFHQQQKQPPYDILAALWALMAVTQHSGNGDNDSITSAWTILQYSTRLLESSSWQLDHRLSLWQGWTQALHWTLLILPTRPSKNNTDTTLWTAWWLELQRLGQRTWKEGPFSSNTANGVDTYSRRFYAWWQGLWNETVPLLWEAQNGISCPLPHEALWIFDGLAHDGAWEISPVQALAWATWLVSSSDDKYAAYQFWKRATRCSTSPTIQVLRRIVTLCLASDAHWNVSLSDVHVDERYPQEHKSRFSLVAPLLPIETAKAESLWEDLLIQCDFQQTMYSPTQQSAALLCGMLLLHGSMSDGFAYLKALVQRYPHLSITLMPVTISLLNATANRGNGQGVLNILEFACHVLVLDPHCATEFWNIVLKLLQPEESDTNLRVTLLRLFPTLCQSNRRLYRRIMETLGSAVGDPSLEIRLAAAVSVAEMAEKDLIRDVSDVIGWIQGWLSIAEPQRPLERLMVHYALVTLHYLVVTEELDFDVVVKVLNKRLCPISDLERIKQLHPVVQEALMQLLGDGECSSMESDEDDEPIEPSISPQVRRAVETLLDMGVILVDSYVADDVSSVAASPDISEIRVIDSLMESLNRYSNLALGLDEQDFRDALVGEEIASGTPAFQCHRRLKRIVLACVENLPIAKPGELEANALVKLTQRLIKFEEDSLGTLLWQKKGGRTKAASDVSIKTVQSMLPSMSSVTQLVNAQGSLTSAIVRLLVDNGTSLEVLRINVDACIETENPVLLVLSLQAQLSIAARLVSAKSQNLEGLLNEVEAWDQELANTDAMYLSMACLSLYMPPKLTASVNGQKRIVEDVAEKVLDAFRGFRFENVELSRITLGLIGASSLRFGNLEISNEIVETLMDSVKGYGGEPSFGSFYGLALIAQLLPLYHQQTSVEDSLAKQTYFRIAGLLVEELLQCYESDENTVTSLLACLKTGTIQDDVASRLRLIPAESLLLDLEKVDVARYLSICCAVALPTLGRLSPDMLSAVLQLFELLEWGGGKGFVMPALLKACHSVGNMKSDEVKLRYQSYSSLLERRIESEDTTVDDLMLAISGASSESLSHILRRRVLKKSDFLDFEANTRILLGVLQKCVCVPCFGAAPFMQPTFVKPGVSKLDIRDVSEALEESIGQKNDSDSPQIDMGLISLAVMVSSSKPRPLSVDSALPVSFVAQAAQHAEYSIKSTDFAKLPSPVDSTVLSGMLDILERAVVQESSVLSSQVVLQRLLGSFRHIALPKQYSRGLLQPLLKNLEDDLTKKACVSLIVSQCHGRRPATMDGSDFVQLYHQLAMGDEHEWHRNLGPASTVAVFVEGLEFFLPKCSQLHVNLVLTNTWRYCWKNGILLHRAFLCMCQKVLNNSNLVRKLVDDMTGVLLNEVLVDLQSLSLEQLFQHEQGYASVFSEFTACLRLIPVSLLDKNDFFRYSKSPGFLDGDMLRVVCSTELCSTKSLDPERGQQERSKITSFLARSLKVMGCDPDGLRHVYCALAETAISGKGNHLADVLEVLLQLPPQSSSFGLQWLALFVRRTSVTRHASPVQLSLAYLWNHDWHASSLLPPLAAMVTNDLPVFLGHLAHEHQITATVFSLLQRLLVHWTTPAASPFATRILKQCLATCRSTASLEDNSLSSIIADSIMTESFRSTDVSNTTAY